MKRKIYNGHTIPYGALAGTNGELRKAYYAYGYYKDQMLPELPVLELDDDIIDPDEIVWQKEIKQIVADILDGLNPKEAKVLRMRFGFDVKDEMTLDDVGLVLDVSKERIRQIEAKALRKLRHPQRKDALIQAIWPKTTVEIEKEKQFEIRKIREENDKILEMARIKQKELQEEKRQNNFRNSSSWIEHLKHNNKQAYQEIKAHVNSYIRHWT